MVPSELTGVLPYLYLFGAGLVAGTVNVIAGGGSALTLPLMIFLGLPPTVANGTNRVAILAQNVSASLQFRRHGFFEGRWLLLAAPAALVGAGLGSWAAIRIGDVAFQKILAGAMVVIALLILWRPLRPPEPGESPDPPESLSGRAFLLAGFFAVGLYGGFIQAGVGFLMLAVTTGAGLDLVRGNALKAALVLLFTILALALFWAGGKVDWGMGAALAVGNVSGSLIGVRLAVAKGHEWIRRVVTVLVVIFAVRLWWTA